MAKLPFMKFYTADWISATRAMSPATKGKYLSLICHIWGNSKTGKMRFLLDDLASLWDCSKDDVLYTLKSLQFNNCISVREFEENSLKIIEILQKRIHRDKKTYDSQSKRQGRYKKRMTLSTTQKLRFADAKVTPEKSEVRSHKKKEEEKASLISDESNNVAKKGITPFWAELMEHVNQKWQDKKKVPIQLEARYFRELKNLARIYQAWGVMALWDSYLALEDDYAKRSGYSFPMFVSKLPWLLDQPGWKAASRQYEESLCGPIGDVISNLASRLTSNRP